VVEKGEVSRLVREIKRKKLGFTITILLTLKEVYHPFLPEQGY